MSKMKNIPNSNGWIDYRGKVLIIKKDQNGNEARFQYDGVSCLQGSIIGFVVDEFSTTSKWFNEEWWYTKTCWGSEYPKKLYFSNGNTPIEKSGFSFTANEKVWEETHAIADSEARPSENIIKAIIKEVADKTGKDYQIDFDNTDYGTHWFEAFVPIKFRNEKYLLTWMNCD